MSAILEDDLHCNRGSYYTRADEVIQAKTENTLGLMQVQT